MMKLFDAHCHLQDPRILSKAPQLIAKAIDTGVVRFAVNGVSEVHNHKHPFSSVRSFLFLFSCLWWHFSGQGVFFLQKDWDLVKQMGENYPSVIPCFGLHPW